MAMHPSRHPCPLMDSPLARSPLGASAPPTLTPCSVSRYYTRHNHQWPTRYQQRSIKRKLRTTLSITHQYPPAPYGASIDASRHQVQINLIRFLSWFLTGAILAVFTPTVSHQSLVYSASLLYNETQTLCSSFASVLT